MAALDSHSGDSEEGLNRRGARDLQCPDSLRDGNTGQPLGQNHRPALEADTGQLCQPSQHLLSRHRPAAETGLLQT